MSKKKKLASEKPEVMQAEDAPVSEEGQLVLARDAYPKQLMIVPLVHRPVFPRMTVPVQVENPELIKALIDLQKSETRLIGLVMARPNEREDDAIRGADLHDVGVIAEIEQIAQANEHMLHVVLSATERFRVTRIAQDGPVILANVDYLFEAESSKSKVVRAYSISLVQSIKELVSLNPLHKEELSLFMSRTDLHEPGRLADIAAALTTASGDEVQAVLETVSIRDRLKMVLVLMRKEIDISAIQAEIGQQIDSKVSKQQRDFFLREQLKAIKKELGLEKEGKQTELDKFTQRLEKLTLPQEARERIDEELDKLRLIEPSSPEFNVSRTYLDWLTILPWGVYSEDAVDIAAAAKILDEDHYGLEDVKERILEFLAVGILKGSVSGSILCFVGPPGVGKTSLGKSIARSMGRKFYRFSLGGMRDEAEIKGHRRTYIGALPGKIVQAFKTCQSANPVLMLDEIDKIGASFQGDPASALLEVLDPEQNSDFLDHYLDVRFDLSNAFFVCTANQTDTIPRPLLDRMEVIHLPGYILEEKLAIARQYLVPKQRREHGLKRRQFSITSAAIRRMIDGYAREPGVRSLEKHIRKIMRKSAKALVEKSSEMIKVDKDEVETWLGKPLFNSDSGMPEGVPGIVLGLAWTSMGGQTLYIEASAVKTGKPGFKQTGQLGEVMVESSEIAYTYVRSLLGEQGHSFFSEHSIHLHVPAGATPKDGPSAGITMAVALYSLYQGRPVREEVAMTGELTLTGLVMPIGGVKEKLIAAKRAKVRHILFPAENERDFAEVPEKIRKGLKVYFVKRFEDVLKIVFA